MYCFVSHLPPGAMWMKAAQMDNLVFSHPEDRNLHQKVFGGFLMRQAFELSWACGWVFRYILITDTIEFFKI